jgi:hypothetical protein
MPKPRLYQILTALNLLAAIGIILCGIPTLFTFFGNHGETPVGIIGGNEGPTVIWISPSPATYGLALTFLLFVNAWFFGKSAKAGNRS